MAHSIDLDPERSQAHAAPHWSEKTGISSNQDTLAALTGSVSNCSHAERILAPFPTMMRVEQNQEVSPAVTGVDLR